MDMIYVKIIVSGFGLFMFTIFAMILTPLRFVNKYQLISWVYILGLVISMLSVLLSTIGLWVL